LSLYTYIDLYENREKKKNIGFVKSEMRAGNWRLRVSIKNLPITDTLMCEMKTLNKEEYIDRFPIDAGMGTFVREYKKEELQERKIRCDEVQGLVFQLASHKYGKCIWKNNQTREADGDNQNSFEESNTYKKVENKKVVEGKETIEKENLGELKIAGMDRTSDVIIEADHMKDKETDEVEETYALPSYECNHIETDKWRQLGRMYTTVHPFYEKEKGEYISLRPKDFVILCEKYQSLVNNSFLLHGYFNYRHIILGKVQEERKNKYYIGVPGTLHEREKKVAVMFGFEKFLGVKSEENGSFGYYMKEVGI